VIVHHRCGLVLDDPGVRALPAKVRRSVACARDNQVDYGHTVADLSRPNVPVTVLPVAGALGCGEIVFTRMTDLVSAMQLFCQRLVVSGSLR
jgi:hypothetical protein